MRILYVTQIVPFPPHGGVLQRGFNILRELGLRHEVHLIAFHHSDELSSREAVERSRQELKKFCKSVEYFSLWPKRSAFHGIVGLMLAGVHWKPFSVLAHSNSGLSKRLREICSGPSKPDIVHLDTIALAQFANECRGVPVVLAHHNVESQLMRRRASYETSLLARLYARLDADKLRRFEAENVGKFCINIMVSDADASELRFICPNARTVVVPNGVDTDYFTPTHGVEVPRVIFTGGMNMFANRDGVDWFIEKIWPALKLRVPQLEFMAIGQKPSPRLLAVAARDSSITAPGFLEDVRPAVAASSVFVVPLRVGGGTRLKVLDGMAQGKAIVSTTLGAEGIEIENGKHLLLADTAEEFVIRIVDLLESRELRTRIGDAARARAAEIYSWRVLAARLADAYANVVGAHSN